MTISLWFLAWTPYLVINYVGIFKTASISPLGTIWGSVFAKANAVYNPIVYGISHPKYRAALFQAFLVLMHLRKVAQLHPVQLLFLMRVQMHKLYLKWINFIHDRLRRFIDRDDGGCSKNI